MSGAIHRIISWYRDPARGVATATDRTVLGVLAAPAAGTTDPK
ncbi:hypothetical protein [Corynebacterium nuruki]|nr:hypothetical protein [Corynebacterium nuruki]